MRPLSVGAAVLVVPVVLGLAACTAGEPDEPAPSRSAASCRPGTVTDVEIGEGSSRGRRLVESWQGSFAPGTGFSYGPDRIEGLTVVVRDEVGRAVPPQVRSAVAPRALEALDGTRRAPASETVHNRTRRDKQYFIGVVATAVSAPWLAEQCAENGEGRFPARGTVRVFTGPTWVVRECTAPPPGGGVPPRAFRETCLS